jgi:hypothetical protein
MLPIDAGSRVPKTSRREQKKTNGVLSRFLE